MLLVVSFRTKSAVIHSYRAVLMLFSSSDDYFRAVLIGCRLLNVAFSLQPRFGVGMVRVVCIFVNCLPSYRFSHVLM